MCARLFFLFLLLPSMAIAELNGEKATVFLERHCVRCHGPDKQKGKVALHKLTEDIQGDLELWERMLDVLEAGEMPPEDEKQPPIAERGAVARWIEEQLTAHAGPVEVVTARRLTNLEYANTMRDLLGMDLRTLVENLPRDPVAPYRFNNTAEFMLLGPEQIDRYLENARRALASAIVDREPPEVHKHRREWLPHGLDRGMANDEIGVWGNRRHSPAWGMGLKSFPSTGAFRIRTQVSAILPPGHHTVPLRLIMGQTVNVNSSTQRVEPIGTLALTNPPDEARVVEFTGRMENIPMLPGGLVITPQNLYDDGTLNDGQRNLALPRIVVHWMEFEAPVFETWPPEHHTRILFDSPLRTNDPPAYLREVLDRFLSRAYRRPATTGELDRFLKIHQTLAPDLPSFEAALRETLALALISPQFLYHTVADADTSRAYERASRLSYFLWRSMPDDELLRLAASGELDKPEVIEAQVRRLLADERSRSFVEDFTLQWLSLGKMQTVPINKELFPRFLYLVSAGERRGTEVPYRPTIRDHMLNESVSFLAELIRRNASLLDIVGSDFAMLNQPLAAHYGVEGVEGLELRPVELTPDHRLGGLLTQGSMLIGNGTGSAPHPIYRAVWLREAILGDEVAPPPADVPALTDTAGESAEKALTIKDLLARHREKESCNDCHVRLDPWGIPFEHYNAIGRYQPFVPEEGTRVSGFHKDQHKDLAGYQAYLAGINTVEVEARARVPHGPEVDGMDELKSFLLEHRREDVARNLLRRLLTFGLGRELTPQDRPAVESLLTQSRQEDHRLQTLIIAICGSEVFR